MSASGQPAGEDVAAQLARPGDEATFLVVRAGRTCWDEAQRVQGKTDLPLTRRGRDDVLAALEAAPSLIPQRLAIVYCGPDEASEQTAQLVAERFGGKVKVLDELVGWDFGLWHGLHEDELASRYATSWERWVEDPTTVTPPNGERASDVQERVAEALRLAAHKAQCKPVAVVLRPLQLAMLTRLLRGEPMHHLWTLAYQAPAMARVALDRQALLGRVLASIAQVGV
jgi:broad specificity phosphatase PhoE